MVVMVVIIHLRRRLRRRWSGMTTVITEIALIARRLRGRRIKPSGRRISVPTLRWWRRVRMAIT